MKESTSVPPAMAADGSSMSEAANTDAPISAVGGLRPIAVTGDSANRVDIVFLGDGYTASQIETTYTAHILDYLSYIFDDSALTQPFGRYENFFNIYAVDVVSNESGADNPVTGTVRDTALDASYRWDGVTDRLLYVSDVKASAAMFDALDGTNVGAEMRYVLVNDTTYGGGGGYFAVYAAGNSSAREVALHEVGHSFARLADEYGGIQETYSGSEPGEINVTTDPAGGKWAEWLGYDDPVLGPVGAYEGGRYYDFGIFRPTLDSKMRILEQPFDPIAREAFVLGFYGLVDPLDSYDDNVGTRYDVQSLSVDVIDPAVIHVDWTVNGQTFVDAGETFSFGAYGLGSGDYTVTARAYDPTDWVRGDRSELEQTVTWTVVNSGQNVAPVITSNGGDDTARIAVPENSSFVTTVTATDPEGTTPAYALVGGADQGRFTIDPVTGILSFNEAPDFETPADSDFDNTYVVEVAATDGALSDFQTVFVEVTDVAGATIVGTAADDVIDAATTVPGEQLPTDEGDTINGARGNDSISALGGDDVVLGRAGEDLISAGAGNDVADGGDEGDQILGEDGDDVLLGGAGWDFIDGGNGNDVIDGGATNDELWGLPGDDTIFGGAGPDRLFGNEGSDYLSGGAGNDLADGGDGNDRLFGKAGDDILRGGSGDDLLDGGKGSDTALFDGVLADYGVAENLVTHLATGEADTLLNIERLRFSDSDLLLV